MNDALDHWCAMDLGAGLLVLFLLYLMSNLELLLAFFALFMLFAKCFSL